MTTLYHFTAKHLWRMIKKEGLTKGALPISMDPLEIEFGYIWLTSNPDFNNQPSLSGTGRLKYSRTEVRLEVTIPTSMEKNLLKFDENKDLTPLYDLLTSQGDPENWYVYKGKIPVKFIRSVKYNAALD